MAQDFKRLVGIDVGEDGLEVGVLPQAVRRRFAQDAQGWQALAQMLAGQPARVVVIEATGGLARPAARLLSAAGIAVAVVNPRHTRQFAKGLGWLAKTDRLDALMLARFGALARPAARPPIGVAQARLQALVLRRRQLAQEINAEGNRLRRAIEPVIRDSSSAHLAWLKAELAALDAHIAAALAAAPEETERAALLASVPGVGPVATSTLLALLPALGRRAGQTIAALAGLAPASSMGKSGRAALHPAPRVVRPALSMATWSPSSTIRDPRLLPAPARRRQSQKACLTAVLRKLLVIPTPDHAAATNL